jgi:hypothetical protein
MKLKISKNAAQERLTLLLTEGYALQATWWKDHKAKMNATTFDSERDVGEYRDSLRRWCDGVQQALVAIFPSFLELHRFSIRQSHVACHYADVNQMFGHLAYTDMPTYLERLASILTDDLVR